MSLLIFYGATCLLLISRLEKGVLVEMGSRSSVSKETLAGGTSVSLLGLSFVVLVVSLPLTSMVFAWLIVVLPFSHCMLL